VLLANYAILLIIFSAYAIVPMVDALHADTFLVPGLSIGQWTVFPAFPATIGLIVLLAVFVVDRTLMGFSIAVESYMQRIALSPDEITGNVSLGQTINHIAAVIVPVAGGIIWESVGSRFTFLVGLVIVLAALAFTTQMQPRERTTGRALNQAGTGASLSVGDETAPQAPVAHP
jgi:predicted MFS family arabinose efflux permease